MKYRRYFDNEMVNQKVLYEGVTSFRGSYLILSSKLKLGLLIVDAHITILKVKNHSLGP